MRDRIRGSLQPVRRRQLGLLLMKSAAWGLIVGSVGGVCLGASRLLGWPVSPTLAVAILAGAPVLAMIIAAIKGRSYKGAASAVDAHYKLKDRARTALDFVTKAEPTALHTLQIEDAEQHLAKVKASEVAPFRLPKTLAYAASLLLLALGLLLWPIAPGKNANAGPAAPIPSIVAEAEKTVERLKELDELAKSERDPELEKLVKELIEKAEEMKQPGVDLKEALAKLSEMQAKIASQQAQYNVGMVDAQLQSLGAAMQAAEATDAAGSALQDGKFDQAVKELEKLEAPPTDKKEAKTLEEKLKQVAQEMGNVGLGQMSGAATEMAEGAKGGSNSKFKKASKTLADLTKGHAGRRRIKQILRRRVRRTSKSRRPLSATASSPGGSGSPRSRPRRARPGAPGSAATPWATRPSSRPTGRSRRSPATRAKAPPRWRRPTPPKASSRPPAVTKKTTRNTRRCPRTCSTASQSPSAIARPS